MLHSRLVRLVRYSAVSVVTVVCNQLVLGLCRWLVPAMSVVAASLVATVIATLPSFELNRRWVWKRQGPSHWRSEVVPFLIIALAGLVASAVMVWLASDLARALSLRGLVRWGVVDGAYLGGFVLVWGLRFWLLDDVVFAPESSD